VSFAEMTEESRNALTLFLFSEVALPQPEAATLLARAA
jgi:hypothetical protein